MVYIFCASALFIAYVLFGYPLALAFVSLCHARPIRKEWACRTVSIILPVHNGARWISNKLNSIAQLDYPQDLLQIIVVDDGSTDGTATLAKGSPLPGLQVLSIPHSGKAAALNAGMSVAHGEILVFTDVRQRLDPLCVRRLVECFADPAVGVVSGELIILSGETQEEADIGLYWRYEKWIRRRLSAIDSVPGATGSLYAMRRNLAVVLPADTLLDDVHLPLAAFFKNFRVIFEERAKAFDYPTALKSEFGRKVRTQAGVYQIIGRHPRLLIPTTRMWFHFLSHKIGRLLLPYALIAIGVSSLALPRSEMAAALIGQAGIYSLAALDSRIGQNAPLKRASSLARTFLVLIAAAFCAPFYLVTTRRTSGWSTTQVRPVAVQPNHR